MKNLLLILCLAATTLSFAQRGNSLVDRAGDPEGLLFQDKVSVMVLFESEDPVSYFLILDKESLDIIDHAANNPASPVLFWGPGEYFVVGATSMSTALGDSLCAVVTRLVPFTINDSTERGYTVSIDNTRFLETPMYLGEE